MKAAKHYQACRCRANVHITLLFPDIAAEIEQEQPWKPLAAWPACNALLQLLQLSLRPRAHLQHAATLRYLDRWC
jgi:hypothetical protein